MSDGTRVKAVCRGGPADGDRIEVRAVNGWPDRYIGRAGANYVHHGPAPAGAPTVAIIYTWVPLGGEPVEEPLD